MKTKIFLLGIILFLFIASASALHVSELSDVFIPTIATVKCDSYLYTTPVNSTFNVNIWLSDVQKCTGWQVFMYYDKAITSGINVIEGPFLKTVGSTFFYRQINNNYNATHGRIMLADVILGMNRMVNGTGLLVTVTFKGIGIGNSLLHLGSVKLVDEHWPSQSIPVVATDSNIQIV